jgi:signal transduction histidine kinase
MAVQVGAARLQLESQDVVVPPQLRAAEETGRSAVADLRRSLGVMRGAEGSTDLDPVPDLSSLPALLARFRDAGLEVELVRCDEPELPQSMQLAAYRIVQECLTNVLKHAGKVPTRVCVKQTPETLEVTVINGPRRTPVPTAVGVGHGLTGMRERVAMYHGVLEMGATPDGGFRVTARLPVATTIDTVVRA